MARKIPAPKYFTDLVSKSEEIKKEMALLVNMSPEYAENHLEEMSEEAFNLNRKDMHKFFDLLGEGKAAINYAWARFEYTHKLWGKNLSYDKKNQVIVVKLSPLEIINKYSSKFADIIRKEFE